MREIKGRIVDSEWNGISSATIILKGTNEGVISDSSGNFIFKMKKDTRPQVLVASCVGCITKEIILQGEQDINGEGILEIKMENTTLGMIYLTGITIVRRTPKQIPLLDRIFKDSSFNNFKVYPNPARVGSLLHFEFKKPVPGIYSIQLFTQTGQVIHREEIELNEKNPVVGIRVPSAIRGTYFIRMRNKKTGKEYPEKIIIQ